MFEETEKSSNSDLRFMEVYLGMVSAGKIRQVARSLAESGRWFIMLGQELVLLIHAI